MVDRKDIQTFVDAVATSFKPDKIILFGSYAYGRPKKDSDVDLLVVMNHRRSNLRMATDIRLACSRHFPMDLLVRAPAEVASRLAEGDPFVLEVISKGKTLYEAKHSRVDRKRRGGLRRGNARPSIKKTRNPGDRVLPLATMR